MNLKPAAPRYTLDDVVLPAGTLEAVRLALVARERADLVFRVWGLDRTHRHMRKVAINLYGPPGTGKTMTAHAIAHSLGRRILVVSYAEIESRYVGDTPKNLTAVFRTAEQEDCVLFFDEADAILGRRLAAVSSATDVSVNQTRSVMLMLLDEFQGVVLFATNTIALYDPAFVRRMLAHVPFDLPDLEARRVLWTRMLPEGMPTDARVDDLAAISEGLSGAGIANAVLMAAYRAAADPAEGVRQAYLVDAVDAVRAGQEANLIG